MKDLVEIAFGLLFLVGAIFNTAYTYRHGEEFFGSFAASAWFVPLRKLIQSVVIPRAKLFSLSGKERKGKTSWERLIH